MAKQDLSAKSISELRSAAKSAGIAAERNWNKADFIKAIAKKTETKKKTAKAAPKKTKRTAAASPKAAPGKKPALKTAAVTGKVSRVKKPAAKKTTSKERGEKVALEAAPRPAAMSKKASPVSPKPAVKRAKTTLRPKPISRELQPPAEEEPRPLPVEYGEDRIVTMTVTPKRLYVYWEVSGETMARHRGNLNLKVFDTKSGEPFYLPLSERIGEYFITVNPDTAYVAEVGVINEKGEFAAMASPRYETPHAAMPDPDPISIDSDPRGARMIPAAGGTAVLSSPLTSAPAGDENLPDEFFALPGSLSSGASGAYPSRELEEGDFPEEFFEAPASISSY